MEYSLYQKKDTKEQKPTYRKFHQRTIKIFIYKKNNLNLFPNNSMVEYLAVNEAVLGSNPSLGVLKMERWLSGLKQKFTKLPMVNSIRRFESYSLRNIIFANKKIPNICLTKR